LKGILGKVPLVVSADPLSLTVLDPPGNWGADIVVGEGQAFGLSPSFGGPGVGLFACRREHLRLAPGRIVGATVDAEGRRAFTLTLQTREQHIRRSRATSNICTNQSLIALAFVVYASVVGPKGLAALQQRTADRALELANALGTVPGLKAPRYSAPFLSEFTVEAPGHDARHLLSKLASRKVLGGVPLGDPRPSGDPSQRSKFLVAAHDGTDSKSIAKYVTAARHVLAVPGAGP
ncbi:MAG: hypothetical protein L3K08_07810, partial [Thermoplasmata archaeon]|nr:hypothetical protein [Thermoplasmata archaeon]